MEKVAIYTRVSTEDQAREGTSLQVQREFLEKFAKVAGYEIYYPEPNKIYEDDGYSGASLTRPALKRLLADAKRKKFDIVLCHKIDRFARNNRMLLNLVEQLKDTNVGFKSATEAFDTFSAAGQMALSMLGTVAQFERDRITERVFPGMIKGVERGHWQGARYAPYGYSYNKEKKMLEIVTEEAKIVSIIYEMYLSNQSTSQIAGYLYKHGYKTRGGGRFYSKLVCDILKNRIYMGKLVWNRKFYDKKQKTRLGYKYVKNDPAKIVEADGPHKAIVSLEEFNTVQEKLQRNRRGSLHRNAANDYPLSGILFCEACGHKFRGAMNTSYRAKGTKKRWYRCNAKQEHHIDCSNPGVKAEEIEPQVFDILEKLVSHPDIKNGRVDRLVVENGGENNEQLKIRKAELESKLTENHEEQKKLYKTFKSNLLAEEVYNNEALDLRRDENILKVELNRVNVELMKKERSETYQKRLKMLLENFDKSKAEVDRITKKELLQSIFQRITIKDKRIEVFEFYEPFVTYWKELKCNLTQATTSGSQKPYILLPTAAR